MKPFVVGERTPPSSFSPIFSFGYLSIIFFTIFLLLIILGSIPTIEGIAGITGTITVMDKTYAGRLAHLEIGPVFLNPGNVSENVVMDTIYVEGETPARIEPTWFIYEPQRFILGPGESQRVNVTLDLPRDAPTGKYQIYARAISQSGGSMKAAVATRIIFDLKPLWTKRLIQAFKLGLLILVGATGFFIALWMSRNLSISRKQTTKEHRREVARLLKRIED